MCITSRQLTYENHGRPGCQAGHVSGYVETAVNAGLFSSERFSPSVSSMPSLNLTKALVAARAWRLETTELAVMQMFSHSWFFFDQSICCKRERRVRQSSLFISS